MGRPRLTEEIKRQRAEQAAAIKLARQQERAANRAERERQRAEQAAAIKLARQQELNKRVVASVEHGRPIPEFKACSQCGTVYRLWDAEDKPLPRPARPRGRPVGGVHPTVATLPFALLHAPRYRGGVRLRDICDSCHAANEAERARAQRKRERTPADREAA